MKFSWIILVIPLFMTSMAANTFRMDKQTYDSCKLGKWILTNVTIQGDNREINITLNIYASETPGGPIYTAHIKIQNCINQTCSEEPEVTLDEINCEPGNNLTVSEMDVCRAVQEAIKEQAELEWMIYRYGLVFGKMLFNMTSCFHFQKTYINADVYNNIVDKDYENNGEYNDNWKW